MSLRRLRSTLGRGQHWPRCSRQVTRREGPQGKQTHTCQHFRSWKSSCLARNPLVPEDPVLPVVKIHRYATTGNRHYRGPSQRMVGMSIDSTRPQQTSCRPLGLLHWKWQRLLAWFPKRGPQTHITGDQETQPDAVLALEIGASSRGGHHIPTSSRSIALLSPRAALELRARSEASFSNIQAEYNEAAAQGPKCL